MLGDARGCSRMTEDDRGNQEEGETPKRFMTEFSRGFFKVGGEKWEVEGWEFLPLSTSLCPGRGRRRRKEGGGPVGKSLRFLKDHLSPWRHSRNACGSKKSLPAAPAIYRAGGQLKPPHISAHG